MCTGWCVVYVARILEARGLRMAMDGNGSDEKPGKLFHLIWLSFGFGLDWFGLVWFGYTVYITIIVV